MTISTEITDMTNKILKEFDDNHFFLADMYATLGLVNFDMVVYSVKKEYKNNGINY